MVNSKMESCQRPAVQPTQELPIEQIKDVYGRLIDDAVIDCINGYGGLEVSSLKEMIGKIWMEQFLPDSRYLDDQTIESVRLMFEEIISSLDSSKDNLADCMALVDGDKKP